MALWRTLVRLFANRNAGAYVDIFPLLESQKTPSTARFPSQRVPLKAKAKYYIPSLEWIPNYSWSLSVLPSPTLYGTLICSRSLGGDVLAGVTVAAMLIPQSVSYATSLARLPPTAGLVSHLHINYLSPRPELPKRLPAIKIRHTYRALRASCLRPMIVRPSVRLFTSSPSRLLAYAIHSHNDADGLLTCCRCDSPRAWERTSVAAVSVLER